MKYTILDLNDREKLLYNDLCKSNRIIPKLQFLTQKQVDLLVSLRGRIEPVLYPGDQRTWKVIGKKKSGGHLTQRFARSFFTY